MSKNNVVVIGGGIVGASCAYYLAKGGLNVTLVEKDSICTEASKSCQGHLFLWELPEINIKLAKESKKLYQQLVDELDIDFELRPTGSMSIAKDAQGFESLAKTLEELKAAGVECELLDREEFLKREPSVTPDIAGGAYFPEDAQLNPLLATLALVEGAKKFGATIKINTEVTALKIDSNNKIQAVVTNDGEIKTNYVVNAAGAWSGPIGKMANVNVPVVPRKGNLMVVEQVPEEFMNCKIIMASGYLDSLKGDNKIAVAANVQQTKEGNLLLGSSREFAGYDKNVNPEVISQIAKGCIKHFPGLAGMHTIRSWAGLRPYSPDMLPMISDTKVQGFYIASGHEGVGITMGPITGLLITQMIKNEKTELPIEQLSIERFEQN